MKAISIVALLVFATVSIVQPVYAQNFIDDVEKGVNEFGDSLNDAGEKVQQGSDDASQKTEDFTEKSGEKSEEAAEAINRGIWQILWDFLFKNGLIMLAIGVGFWVIVGVGALSLLRRLLTRRA